MKDQSSPGNVNVSFDGIGVRGVYPRDLLVVSVEQPKFSTAWLDKGELTATGNTFFTQADADNFANAEVEANPGTEMVVVQMVSKHSSSVKVETVAL